MILCLTLLAWAQLEKPPEFSTGGGFRKSEVDAAIDSAAHTSGQKTASAKWMVRSLQDWPRLSSDEENAAWLAATRALTSGALGEAERLFTQSAKRFPASVRLAVGQAAAIYAQGAYERSAAVLLRTARQYPRELRLIRYVAEMDEWAHAEVLTQLQAWASANPKSAEAQYAYGALLAPAAGERYLLAASRLAPGDPRPHLALAKFSTGQKALDHLTAAAQCEPGNAEVHYRLAQAYTQAGNRAKAAEHMERYKALKR